MLLAGEWFAAQHLRGLQEEIRSVRITWGHTYRFSARVGEAVEVLKDKARDRVQTSL